MRDITIIDMHQPQVNCCICNKISKNNWGVPIDDAGVIVSNDYKGEWSSKPACKSCWEKHENGEFVGKCPEY